MIRNFSSLAHKRQEENESTVKMFIKLKTKLETKDPNLSDLFKEFIDLISRNFDDQSKRIKELEERIIPEENRGVLL